MNIINILREQAASRPRSPAIIDERAGRSLTFAELEMEAARTASFLKQSGLKAGDSVLVFYPMSAELYVILLAIFRLGLVAMFLDPSSGREHIEQCCALNPPAALIASFKAHLLRFVSPALRRIPAKFVIGAPAPGAIDWNRASSMKPLECVHECDSNAPALLTFTSGSTGEPKAAARSHGFLIAQHRALAQSLNLAAGDVDLTTLPVFVLANLASGVTSLLPKADMRFPGKVAPAPVISQIREHEPTSLAASPAFLERLVERCERTGERLYCFEKIFTGGAPVFPRLLERLQHVAPRAQVFAVYGSTEAEPIAEIARHKISNEDIRAQTSGRGLLAGAPVEAINLRIMRDRWGASVGPFTAAGFEAECLPAGETGEIVVSGDHVLSGYLNGRGNAETKIEVDGIVWHRTGDAGYLDAEGRLWLMGRCGARIEDRRGIIYPFAVECAVSERPQVRRAALASHRERRVLALELSGCIDIASLREDLAWARLDEVRVYRRVPTDKRHNAKIDYPALRALLDRTPLKRLSG